MPLFISHIYYSKKFLNENNVADSFVLGTISNDIGYFVPSITREKTHFLFINNQEGWSSILKKIESTPNDDLSFYLGMIFHMFIDRWWRDNIYISSKSKHIGLILKIIDEIYCFRYIDIKDIKNIIERKNSQLYTRFLDNKNKKEIDLFINFIIKYCNCKYPILLLLIFLIKKGKISKLEIPSFIIEFVRVWFLTKKQFRLMHSTKKRIPVDVYNKILKIIRK